MQTADKRHQSAKLPPAMITIAWHSEESTQRVRDRERMSSARAEVRTLMVSKTTGVDACLYTLPKHEDHTGHGSEVITLPWAQFAQCGKCLAMEDMDRMNIWEPGLA